MRYLWPAVICVLAALLPSAAQAQFERFCQLTDVKVEILPNAVRIRMITDGLIDASVNDYSFAYDDPETGDWVLQPVTRIQFSLDNVRGGTSSTIGVGQYPVSHLEFALPRGSRESIGLVCTLVLYRSARFAQFLDQWDRTRRLTRDNPGEPQISIVTNQSRDELIITVTGDRANEPTAARPEGPEVPPQLEVRREGRNLTLRAVNADTARVFESLSWEAGEPVFLDDAVKHKVTAYIENRPLDELVGALAASYGLSVTHNDAGYFVSVGVPETAAGYWASSTRTIQLKYLRPENARDLLPDMLLPYLRPNSDANALAISGPPQMLDKVEQDLQALDKPARHVLLRAWMVSAQKSDAAVREVMARVAGGTSRWEGSTQGDLQIDVGPQTARSILAELRALQQRRKVQIRSMPSIQAANGQSASLFVGQDIYYFKLLAAAEQGFTLASVDVGARLEMRPWSGGEWITADMKIESGVLDRINGLGPLLLRRLATGTIRLRSGDTVVIGGLQTSSDARSRRRPLAPWPGEAVLSGHDSTVESQDLWILVEAETSEGPVRGQTSALALSGGAK